MTFESASHTKLPKTKVLIVSATEAEYIKIKQRLESQTQNPGVEVEYLATGVGGAAAAVGLALRAQPFDLIILTGIAGGFRDKVSIGDVVQVVSDCFADLGVDDNGVFKSVFDIGLADANEPPFKMSRIEAKSAIKLPLKAVKGITLNTVSGSKEEIEKLRIRYPEAAIETMEGAYVHYAAQMMNKQLLHLRGISNYIEPRNRADWKIHEAIEAVSLSVVHVLNNLSSF